MALFGNKNPKPDDTPFLAPEPEEPEAVSARAERLKNGKVAAAKRKILDSSDETSTGKRFLVGEIPTAQTALVAANFLTDLPAEWLFSVAFLLVRRKDEGEAADAAAEPPKRDKPPTQPPFHFLAL